VKCSVCGCEGIHACIGHKPAPWTAEDKARLFEALKAISVYVPIERECCGTFEGTAHRATCPKYRTKVWSPNSEV
jgi:hypothetical protein